MAKIAEASLDELLAKPHLPGNGRPAIDPNLWWPTALVVVVERRLCRCGQEYICPGLAPAVEWVSIYPPHRRLIRAPGEDDPLPAMGLPQRHHSIITPITACPSCFTPSGPDGPQLSLGPTPRLRPPSRPIPRQVLGDTELSGVPQRKGKVKKAKRVFTLDDF